jgi:NAD(P)-dependent dehydrogenase (short-subunit alcohol dehydrogenase family)
VAALLAGKAVIVTGAGTGLGRAYALDAAAHGASVVVNDHDEDTARVVTAEIAASGGTAVVAVGSVSSWSDAEALVRTCRATFGTVDGLVNNAGVIRLHEPWDADEAGIRAMVETNLMGAAFVGVHALRVMAEQGSGSIVNNTSSAQLGLPLMAVYGATKGALASLTYGWALALASRGVRANAYSPVADTAMITGTPMNHVRLPTPEENAPVVTYLLSDLAAGVTGQVVQRREDSLVVMSHPDLTEHTTTPAAWTVEAVHRGLGPLLERGRQPVGDPRVRPCEPTERPLGRS